MREHGARLSGARREALHAREPLGQGGVIGIEGASVSSIGLLTSPQAAELRSVSVDPFLGGERPVVVRGPGGARDRCVHDQRAHALGVIGGEQRADEAAEGVGEERRAFAARGVEHRERVVRHPARASVGCKRAVGEPGAAAVEQDQAVEDGQPLEEAAHRRRLPELLDLGDPAGQEQQVERALAGHLVGDARVAAARIARGRAPSDAFDQCAEGRGRLDRGAGGVHAIGEPQVGGDDADTPGSESA